MVSRNMMTFLNTVILIMCTVHVQAQESDECTTPNNESGECTDVSKCRAIVEILKHKTLKNLNYVLQSTCRYNNRTPIVCCPSEDQNYDEFPQSVGSTATVTREFADSNTPNEPTTPSSWEGEKILQPDYPEPNDFLLPKDCGSDLSTRIVGGNFTELDEFPWMAILEFHHSRGISLACGGSLINKRYVVTAAHCLRGPLLSTSWRLAAVRLGEHNTATDPDCIPYGEDDVVCAPLFKRVKVEKEIIHEKYAPTSRHQLNDIALIRLAKDVSFTNYVKPICLPIDARVSKRLQVAGWGKTEGRSESEVKLKVSIPLADKRECAKVYEGVNIFLGPGQFCAGGEQNRDSCTGDSGGPIMQMDRMPNGLRRWSIVGVVSFGPRRCGTEGWPGVYTKTYDFKTWILQNMKP